MNGELNFCQKITFSFLSLMFINCGFIMCLTEDIHGRVGSNEIESCASFQELQWTKHQPTHVPEVADIFSLFLV